MSRESTVEYEISHDTASLTIAQLLEDCSDNVGDCGICRANRLCERVYNRFTTDPGLRMIRLTPKHALKKYDNQQIEGRCGKCSEFAPLYKVSNHNLCEPCALKQRSYEALMGTAKYKCYSTPYYDEFKSHIDLVMTGAYQPKIIDSKIVKKAEEPKIPKPKVTIDVIQDKLEWN